VIGITLLLVAAAIAFGLAHATRIPAVPLLIAAGLGLGASDILPSDGTVDDTLQLGLAFLVFAAGTDLNPARFLNRLGLAARIALLQFATVAGITFGTALLAGFDAQNAFLLGLALAASSTLVVVRVLHQRRQLSERFGRLVIGVLLIQDALVILLITVMSVAGRPGLEVLGVLGAVLGLVALTWVCVRWVTPLLMVKLGLEGETLLLVILSILFAFAGIAWWIEIPIVVGAFLAGVSMSAFPVSGVIRAPMTSLNEFFVALFFVSLGATFSAPESSDLTLALLLVALVVLVTPILVAILAERAGLTARTGIEAGLLLAQTSEFSLVVALMGRSQGWLAPGLFEVIVLVTLTTMALTPLLSRDTVVWRLVHLHPARRWGRRRPTSPPSGHIVLLGCGQNGMHILERLHGCGQQVIAVDDDPGITDAIRRLEVPALRGDGADPKVLREAGAASARLIVSTMRRVEDSLRMMRHVDRETPVLVRVFSEAEAAQIRAAGGQPIIYADAAADAVLAWLEGPPPGRGPVASPDEGIAEEPSGA